MSCKFLIIDDFQEQLNKMRSLDDKLIYALNMSLPTVSIKARTDSNPAENCKELYESLRASHTDRGKFIDDCILVTADQVKSLKTQLDSSDDTKLEKQFKSEQRKVKSTQELCCPLKCLHRLSLSL